jgi:Urease, gamma subunit
MWCFYQFPYDLRLQVLELIRSGKSVAELMNLGRQMLGLRQVMPGVAALLHDVQVEGTFADGTKLVTIHEPITQVSAAIYASSSFVCFLYVTCAITTLDVPYTESDSSGISTIFVQVVLTLLWQQSNLRKAAVVATMERTAAR